jgi:exocyst complex component 4
LPAFSAAIKNKPTVAAQLAMSNTKSANLNNLNSQLSSAVLAANVELEQFDIELMSKEVETLISNLNDKELEEMDIITNYNYIEMIAHLHESCDWLIAQLKYINGSLEQMVKNPKSLNNSLSLGELNRLTKQLDDLNSWRGDTLLLLYLEIRVHCFYHLLNFVKQENNISYSGDVDTDPDESVLNMNRDLHRIYEHLSRSLQESKVNYVFDALGFMIASIFIRAIKNFKKISTHGIAKMCRNIFNVEQNLSAIRTKSDPHLMRAHRFYELLYKKPEELLNHLIEHEAEFKLSDYVNLLNLIYRSQPGYEINSLSDNIQQLTNILKNKNNQ